MYKKIMPETSTIEAERIIEGETIEDKVARILNNGEAISDGAPEIFTERKDGVQAEYNPRTDKWDIAIDAMDKVTKGETAKRAKMTAIKGGENDKNEGKNDGKAESTEGTSN